MAKSNYNNCIIVNWEYQGKTEFEIPENAFGFVYLITKIGAPLYEKSRYIGRKYLNKSIKKTVKKKDGTNSSRKKCIVKESNWRTYTGSCISLNEEIKKSGIENFKFEILAFGATKGEVNFLEEYVQMKYGVIFKDEFYNDSIGAKGFIGVKFTNEFKEVLKNLFF